MRLCLIPLKTTPRDVAVNLSELEQRLREVSRFRPDLICLPECTLTGYLYEEADVQIYCDGVKAVGVTTAIVNALEIAEKDSSFGGALMVGKDGRVLAESPHGTDEVLVYEL